MASLFAPQVEKNRRYITIRNKKWIAILMAALILVCGNTVAFANGDLTAVYIEDTEADINIGPTW